MLAKPKVGSLAVWTAGLPTFRQLLRGLRYVPLPLRAMHRPKIGLHVHSIIQCLAAVAQR